MRGHHRTGPGRPGEQPVTDASDGIVKRVPRRCRHEPRKKSDDAPEAAQPPQDVQHGRGARQQRAIRRAEDEAIGQPGAFRFAHQRPEKLAAKWRETESIARTIARQHEADCAVT